MNKKPLRPCNIPGCGNLSDTGYCTDHKNAKKENNRYYDKFNRNKKHDSFYHSKPWIKCRNYIRIRDNGLCQRCLEDKKITVGTVVDHTVPISVDWERRLDELNLRLLCISCHNIKTAEDLETYGKT